MAGTLSPTAAIISARVTRRVKMGWFLRASSRSPERPVANPMKSAFTQNELRFDFVQGSLHGLAVELAGQHEISRRFDVPSEPRCDRRRRLAAKKRFRKISAVVIDYAQIQGRSIAVELGEKDAARAVG